MVSVGLWRWWVEGGVGGGPVNTESANRVSFVSNKRIFFMILLTGDPKLTGLRGWKDDRKRNGTRTRGTIYLLYCTMLQCCAIFVGVGEPRLLHGSDWQWFWYRRGLIHRSLSSKRFYDITPNNPLKQPCFIRWVSRRNCSIEMIVMNIYTTKQIVCYWYNIGLSPTWA